MTLAIVLGLVATHAAAGFVGYRYGANVKAASQTVDTAVKTAVTDLKK